LFSSVSTKFHAISCNINYAKGKVIREFKKERRKTEERKEEREKGRK
jgi:hypothetical protein